ncbi:MAG: 50S ribosomal protein L29 [Thermaerobacterales bacterium]
MNAAQIRELNDGDLEKKLKDLKEELFNLRFQRVAGRLENPLRIREIKRDIARAMTIRHERQLGTSKLEGAR